MPESQRLAFLDVASGGDASLFQAVVRLLVAHAESGSFLSDEEARPASIGRYEITGELGRGAMGIVYEAKDPLIGRTIAVKTIRANATSRPDEAKFLQQQLLKEATAAGQLSHPNIVTIHDVGMEGDVAFIAMEKVEGASLQEVLSSGNRLEPQAVIHILQQCAQALDYAHRKGILHRDVKPANIMVQHGDQVKIADFGIAKNTLSPQQTGFGFAMGTPSYMSPEQIRMEPLDGRSDQFSLAVVAYELLVGIKPFAEDTVITLFSAIREGPRPSAHAFNPQLSVAVDGVLQRALARLPAERYATCEEFISGLRATCETGSVTTKAGRRGIAVAAAGVFALATLAGGTVYWRFLTPAVEQPVPPKPPPFPEVSSHADPGLPSSVKPALQKVKPGTRQDKMEPPVYKGPKEGRIVWTGDLEPGQEIDLGSRASSASGALPGVPVAIEVHPSSVQVVTPPGSGNHWRKLVIRNEGTKQVIVLVKWTVISP